MIDKNYCMSSYLVFRYIVDEDKNFFENIAHNNYELLDADKYIEVETAIDIDKAITEQIKEIKNDKLGILLSGGMDSAILASYLSGCKAYTFRFQGGGWQKAELNRAMQYAEYYGLDLHFVDIDWNSIQPYIDMAIKEKGAPVHSIEPQLVQAALQAKEDGVERIIIGNAADYVFGGMDKLLSIDWRFEEFVQRYTYTNPADVLVQAIDMSYVFEDYRIGQNVDYLSFLNRYAVIESYGSYKNAFSTANMPYTDLYERLVMKGKLDLVRIRNGESKYLIRELFKMKYPDFPIPEKIPMPRPVDFYFENWEGPTRKEFKQNLDMKKYTGNQKWQMWCLEHFLNLLDEETNN